MNESIRRLATRSARIGSFLLDCLLLALLPTAFFYPAYYSYIPSKPPPPLLPLDLLTPEERQNILDQTLAWESAITWVFIVSSVIFMLAFFLYYIIFVSRQGQTFGMATASIQVLSPKGTTPSLLHTTIRAFGTSLAALLFFSSVIAIVNAISLFFVSDNFEQAGTLLLSGIIILMFLLASLWPKRSSVGKISGTYLTKVSGDIIEQQSS